MDYEQRVYDLEYENKKLREQNKELEEEIDFLCEYKDNIRTINRLMKLKVGKIVYHHDNYAEEFESFWIPILKKQYFKYMITNDKKAIVELEDNVWKNWNLSKEEKRKILKEIRGKNGR